MDKRKTAQNLNSKKVIEFKGKRQDAKFRMIIVVDTSFGEKTRSEVSR